jgi:hypothetical protein
MAVTSASKLSIAVELLERAIELHLRGDSYYAAIHLAGAAEELLNVYTRQIQLGHGVRMKPTFDQIKDGLVAILNPQSASDREAAEKWAFDRMTWAKNSVKHMRGAKDIDLQLDAEVESEDVIDRAVSTYLQIRPTVGLPLVHLIQAFDNAHHGRAER